MINILLEYKFKLFKFFKKKIKIMNNDILIAAGPKSIKMGKK